ncbi:DUF4405 domain-containing protein [uncultured Desulfobacter sp.]|uniref:DUF4405 domain-containing protein n=1 Tax=uncultured Desulfobacter sp. TaxID=240139 RepID=UPI002AAC257A|nr:DUF4405 domain-containing protein [uncultured Desulfobacter sp.]
MFKKTTSLTLAFSGLIMLVTSIVLYFGPAGQVAHFCPWQFWGLNRHYWMMLHLNSGVLFCLAMLVHTWLNWRLLTAYMNLKKSGLRGIALAVSLVLTLYVCIGGCFNLSPMKQLIGVARNCRIASLKAYGSPPYGSAADYPVALIAGYMGWNPQKAMARLTKDHIALESPEQSLNDLACANHTTLGHLLDVMCPDSSEN